MKTRIFIIGFLGLFLLNPIAAAAKTSNSSIVPSSIPSLNIGTNNATVTFGDLGYLSTDMISPYDSTQVLFSIPPNWRLGQGGEVDLNFDVNLSGADVAKITTDANVYGGVLTVIFNKQVIGSIRLTQQGNQLARLQIPPEALLSSRNDGRHQLQVILNSQFSCQYNIRAVVTINAASVFNLNFVVSPPVLNLAQIPMPFYARNSLVPERTLFITPDAPSTQDMQATLDVIAGFGSLVGPDFLYDVVANGQLTADEVNSSNLIFVGEPNQFSQLSAVSFPTKVANGQFVNLPADSAKDGVLELAFSPWNATKEVMLVSGNTSDAVLKAAQAISVGKVFVYNNPVLAYISDVQTLPSALPTVLDVSLKDLGYQTTQLTGVGVTSNTYSFNVSKEQVGTQNGSFDLVYYHSGLLDYSSSSLSVDLNGQTINTTPYSKESENLTTLHILIPPGLLRTGENRLTVSADTLPVFACNATGIYNPWFTIVNDSAIHLPIADSSIAKPYSLDLKFYPNFLTTQSDLGDIAFVLPKNDPNSWKIAGDLAYDLARNTSPSISNLSVVFADNAPKDILANHSLIFIGMANKLPLLGEINNKLPAPFDLTNNTASQGQLQVIYRIPPGVNVGYLELLASPYNPDKVALIVSGNGDGGLPLASSTLILGHLRDQLAGVFAVTNGSQVALGYNSTIYSIISTVVPGVQPIAGTPVSGLAETAAVNQKPVWLIPIIVFLCLVTLSIIAIVVVREAPQFFKGKGDAPDPNKEDDPNNENR